MPSTSSILSDFETCPRKGYWGRSYAPQKLSAGRMVTEALHQALTATEAAPWGDIAGSAMLQLAQDRGLETESCRIYQSAIHHAAIADLIATVLRKPTDPPWQTPEPVQSWTPACYISPDGKFLRRIVLVSHWTDQRHAAEVRSWHTLGEIAHYNLPMQMIVVILGQLRDGLRTSSPWASGFLHPQNHLLRFRKKSRLKSEVFNDKWEKIYREDHGEIDREDWLEAMNKDDVLREVIFREDIPVPPSPHLLRVRQMAQAKLERLYALKQTPEANLSGCDWPVACPFIKLCHVLPEKEPQEKYGFVRIESIRSIQPVERLSPIHTA